MNGYTKLFGSIIASTIWRESLETKVVWITMLAMSNKHGIVEASVPGLADMARVTLAETQKALEILAAPDTFSRTKEFEGRRIEPVDGGWVILNHAKYREKMSLDERREYNRVKQQEFRERQKRGSSTNSQQTSNTVIDGQSQSAMSAHTEADTDTKAEEEDSIPGGESPSVEIPYAEVVVEYHVLCPCLPKVSKLTDGRKKAIKARWLDAGENPMEYFRTIFRKARESDFLSGRNGQWTACCFDWLLNPANGLKVFEGNYVNKPAQNAAAPVRMNIIKVPQND